VISSTIAKKAMTKPTGLRTKKAAIIKLKVLQSSLELIGKKPFKELYVDEICKKVAISKVTLFKYFPQKEDILRYYFRIWCFHQVIEITQQEVEGVDGLYFLFDKIGEEYEKHPGMIMSLITYQSSLNVLPKPFTVKKAEREVLYPQMEGLSDIEILSLEQLLEKFALEAIFKKQITKTSNTQDLTSLFMMLFYGTLMTCHRQKRVPVKVLFKQNLRILLASLA
jgi:AcrR family transcriptional regulator